ncbi:mannose-1-phosphate guanylyltransferase [Solimonas aquatica]|uniref:Mannose-1-phosphate guanylyltransferase n=1 Tax=Solimonas aquatica TaxID=489703 RepID=A0A1H9CLE2_9GAMM|nr:mannose-1-phosphate guanylyltransferase [Solimonas aquatica]SEQ01513.1 mannose-1-phosphate guanylyltransferase [Solimonas aquatica]
MRLVPTILCGGAGSRLWPVSRELHPKPFIRMADGQSLLQKAFLRASGLPQVQEILTVTNRELFFKTQDEFREVNRTGLATAYILEPYARNTAAAVAAAALEVSRVHGEDALLLVLAADHLIDDEGAFQAAVREAQQLAITGKLVTFGIRPHSPETGFGYIEAENRQVRRFVEKPSAQFARDYLASGKFLWNAGMFCFAAAAVLREMTRHCPDVLTAVRDCVRRGQSAEGVDFRQLELPADAFSAVPSRSFDYALLEPASRAEATGSGTYGALAVVPCELGWSDVGSWEAIGELVDADSQNNRIEGRALMHDSRNCYVRSPDRLASGLGLDNLMIVDTADAVLVADRAHALDVRVLYERLKADDHEAHRRRRTAYRPWGELHSSSGRPRLQDQADRGQTTGQSQLADASPPQRTLGRRQRCGHGHQW